MKKYISFLLSLFIVNHIFSQEEMQPARIIVTPQHPLSKDSVQLREALVEWTKSELKKPVDLITEHPSAKFFPGSVKPGFKFTNQIVTVDHKFLTDSISLIIASMTYSNPFGDILYSTGMYAVPGEYIEINTAQDNMSVQIGAHSDPLNYFMAEKEDWRRMPIISRTDKLKKGKTKVASPFGGLIYIKVPVTAAGFKTTVTIRHAVKAPLFEFCKTTIADWKQQLKENKAPWGEIAGNDIVLTLPDSVLQQCDDPEKMMKLWDLIVEGEMDLAQLPTPFYRKQRMVVDEHMAGGFMHSGYPIMVHHSLSKKMLSTDIILNPEKLMTPSNGGANWGYFHEIGHNMQNLQWVFGGTTEVSCNFFSLYMFDRLIGGRDGAHSNISNAATQASMHKYFKEGPSYEKWKADPFLGLIMFRQLQENFGWEAYKQFFKKYQEVAKEYLEKKQFELYLKDQDDQKKIDRWVTTFSSIVNKNLSTFFETWGIPVSKEVTTFLNKYPTWMPYNFPLNN